MINFVNILYIIIIFNARIRCSSLEDFSFNLKNEDWTVLRILSGRIHCEAI